MKKIKEIVIIYKMKKMTVQMNDMGNGKDISIIEKGNIQYKIIINNPFIKIKQKEKKVHIKMKKMIHHPILMKKYKNIKQINKI